MNAFKLAKTLYFTLVSPFIKSLYFVKRNIMLYLSITNKLCSAVENSPTERKYEVNIFK